MCSYYAGTVTMRKKKISFETQLLILISCQTVHVYSPCTHVLQKTICTSENVLSRYITAA